MSKDDQRLLSKEIATAATPKKADSIEGWSRAVVGRFRGKRRVVQLSERAEREFNQIFEDFVNAIAREAIRNLTEPTRHLEARRLVLILRLFLGGVSASEIARLLQMKVKTVENILVRQLALLRRRVQYEEVEDVF